MPWTYIKIHQALVLPFLLAGCFGGPPPGKGEKAEQGYNEAKPIIAALEKWRSHHGSYPNSIDELLPTYLEILPTPNETYSYTYHITKESYELWFKYTGPGMNVCAYSPEDSWNCSGYL